MVIRELLSFAEKTLCGGGCENSRFESEIILRSVLGIDALALVLRAKDTVSESNADAVISCAKRRAAGEPLEYILQSQEFMSLEFKVNPSVLIPRADTETLVETVIEICRAQKEQIRVLDIGAGSGCIGISIARYAENTLVTELDISAAALDVAAENAKRNNVYERMRFEQCDILTGIPDTADGCFDIVVSNPPYIETSVIETLDHTVKDFEPRAALDGGEDGLVFYRRIVQLSDSLLAADGYMAFEIGYNQGDAVKELMERRGFDGVSVIKDLCGNDRVVKGKK